MLTMNDAFAAACVETLLAGAVSRTLYSSMGAFLGAVGAASVEPHADACFACLAACQRAAHACGGMRSVS